METRMTIVALALLVGISGCATIDTQMTSHRNYSKSEQKYNQSESDCKLTIPHVYSGTVSAFERILFPLMCPCGGESGLAFLAYYPFFLPLFIIDLPLSAAADTIVLPYTTYRQIKFGNIERGCKYD